MNKTENLGGMGTLFHNLAGDVKIQVDVIEDLTVISGNNKNVQPPSGYEKIDVDLNESAGGSYIYICVKKGSDLKNAITELAVVEGKGASAPSGFEKINVDLNEKAGGKYLYLCKKRGDGQPIQEIQVISEKSKVTSAPSGFKLLDRDLNEKAGGKYIYLCYR